MFYISSRSHQCGFFKVLPGCTVVARSLTRRAFTLEECKTLAWCQHCSLSFGYSQFNVTTAGVCRASCSPCRSCLPVMGDMTVCSVT